VQRECQWDETLFKIGHCNPEFVEIAPFGQINACGGNNLTGTIGFGTIFFTELLVFLAGKATSFGIFLPGTFSLEPRFCRAKRGYFKRNIR
jgi:hypothetical protein